MSKQLSEKTTSVKLHADWIKRLDDLAKRGGISRHQFMRNLVGVSLDQFTTLRAVGFFKVGLAVRDLQEKLGKPSDWKASSDEKPIPITLSESELELIDRYAAEADLSRNQFIRNLIYVGIEEVEIFKRIGAFQINDACVWLSKAFSEIIDNGHKALKAIEH